MKRLKIDLNFFKFDDLIYIHLKSHDFQENFFIERDRYFMEEDSLMQMDHKHFSISRPFHFFNLIILIFPGLKNQGAEDRSKAIIVQLVEGREEQEFPRQT